MLHRIMRGRELPAHLRVAILAPALSKPLHFRARVATHAFLLAAASSAAGR